jgi:hypothetical protein
VPTKNNNSNNNNPEERAELSEVAQEERCAAELKVIDPYQRRDFGNKEAPMLKIMYPERKSIALDPGTTRHYTVLMRPYSHTLHSTQVLRGTTLYSCAHTRIHCTRPRYYAALHCTHTLILTYTAFCEAGRAATQAQAGDGGACTAANVSDLYDLVYLEAGVYHSLFKKEIATLAHQYTEQLRTGKSFYEATVLLGMSLGPYRVVKSI